LAKPRIRVDERVAVEQIGQLKTIALRISTDYLRRANRICSDSRTLHRVMARRFIEEQGISEADEIDQFDAAGLHMLVTIDGRPVVPARL
jgi:hypothetical protein